MSNDINNAKKHKLPGNLPLRVTDVKKLLQESELRFRELADAAPVGIFLDDAEGNAIFINKKCAELVGVPADHALSFNWMPYLHPDDRNRMVSTWKHTVATKGEFHLEYRWLHKDGKIVWTLGDVVPIFDDKGDVTLYVGTLTDITARKLAQQEKDDLQEQLMQAQKMESIGRMAGGIAHDYNNMLQVITAYTEEALDNIDSDHAVHNTLLEIYKAAKRSTELTKQLLTFARKQTVTPSVFDINTSIEEMLSLLERLMGQGVDIQWTAEDAPILIKMDPTQLHQVIMNLCINARDAIRDAGEIVIETSIVKIDQSYCDKHLEASTGEFALLSVNDNGMGMTRITTKNIFEPFFTTKDSGEKKGTGLGLATVYGIVKQNNGFIEVDSEPGNGTSFKIYLPHIKT